LLTGRAPPFQAGAGGVAPRDASISSQDRSTRCAWRSRRAAAGAGHLVRPPPGRGASAGGGARLPPPCAREASNR